ncbi:MAG: hypothetical protein R3Y56_11365 [Akkermansia sp.]
MDLRSYKDNLSSYGLSIKELAEGMQESPLAMERFLSQSDAPEDLATILQLCKIDKFCEICTLIEQRRWENTPLLKKIWARIFHQNIYLPEAKEAYQAWASHQQSKKAQQNLVRIFQSAHWRQGSDVYIKRTTNLEQASRRYRY